MTASSQATSSRVGQITRELHEALQALGSTPQLQRLVNEIPDARARLSHVGALTETAAHRVLNLVDAALADVDTQGRRLQALLEGCETDQGLKLALLVGEFAKESAEFERRQKQILSEIMLAQDFQDLSGQVIKKVIDVITRTEHQLVQLLVDDPDGQARAAEVIRHELQGPQVPDSALQQDDVDGMLASLEF